MQSPLIFRALANIDRVLACVNFSGGSERKIVAISGKAYTLKEIHDEIERGTPVGQEQAVIWSVDEKTIQAEVRAAQARVSKTRL